MLKLDQLTDLGTMVVFNVQMVDSLRFIDQVDRNTIYEATGTNGYAYCVEKRVMRIAYLALDVHRKNSCAGIRKNRNGPSAPIILHS